MKKSYVDQCLERASLATEGPWMHIAEEVMNTTVHFVKAQKNSFCISIRTPTTIEPDAEFIAASRTDVVELAQRLKRACEALREAAEPWKGDNQFEYVFDDLMKLASELEAPLFQSEDKSILSRKEDK
jgi:hypothetical protein